MAIPGSIANLAPNQETTDTQDNLSFFKSMRKEEKLQRLVIGTDGYLWSIKNGKYDKKYELFMSELSGIIKVKEVKED